MLRKAGAFSIRWQEIYLLPVMLCFMKHIFRLPPAFASLEEHITTIGVHVSTSVPTIDQVQQHTLVSLIAEIT